jgi:replication factor A3
VEIIGKVDGNLNVKVQAATDFGTNIGKWILRGGKWNVNADMFQDFNAANAVVEATHRHKAIFYDGE